MIRLCTLSLSLSSSPYPPFSLHQHEHTHRVSPLPQRDTGMLEMFVQEHPLHMQIISCGGVLLSGIGTLLLIITAGLLFGGLKCIWCQWEKISNKQMKSKIIQPSKTAQMPIVHLWSVDFALRFLSIINHSCGPATPWFMSQSMNAWAVLP